ncbi:hypothetical protein LPJ64_004594, partial [Coemansia asiatica]
MENYHNYPTQYNPEQYNNQGPMHPSHMMYPHIGGIQMMGPMHGPAMVGPMMSYPAAMPNMSNGSKQPITRSAHVISEPACHVYRADESAEAVEFTTRQLIAFDGKVFVEHIPGHNVIYAPISLKPQHVLQSSAGSRVAKLRLKPKKVERPKNIFFKYRSQKVKELQIMYPKLNQTVISRIAAEHWKNEKPEVKEKFKKMYQGEMVQYELAKKIKRAKGNSYFDSDNDGLEIAETSSLNGETRQASPYYGNLSITGPDMSSRPATVDHTSPVESQNANERYPPMEMTRQR